MKNVPVNEDILPQVLSYAFWAQSNPDSIKNLWLEAPKQPEDVEFQSDNYGVRIVIIAPSIGRSTLSLIDTINYPIDLIEVKRWAQGSNQFLLVNALEPEQPKKVRPVRGLEVYDRTFYKNHYNKRSVAEFFRYVKETEQLIKSEGWPLETKFNKGYCSFKFGFFNAFGITWIGTKTFAFFFRLPKPTAEKAQPRSLTMDRYADQWKQAVYIIDPATTRVKPFLPLFRHAMESLAGKQ